MAVFGPFIALDPSQIPTIAKSSAGKVYAVGDDALETPLAMTDLVGIVITDALSDANGLVQAFQVDGHSEVVWVSGDYRVPVRSYGSVLDRAVAAEVNAESAAASAAASEASAQTSRVPVGGTSGQVLAKASNTDNDVTWINPPTGGSGSGSGILVLGVDDPIPPGTPAMTAIFRLEGDIPTPDEIKMLTGGGNLTSAYGSLTTSQTLPAPANTTAGDLLIAIGWGQASVSPFDWSVPAGWTSHFESTSGRRMLVASYPVVNSEDAGEVTGTTHTFSIPGDAQNTRNGVMIFRVTGANLANPVVGMSDYSEESGTSKTFAEFAASSPAAAQLCVSTAQLSAGWTTHPVTTYAPGYQAINEVMAYNTDTVPAESVGTVVLYQISGTAVPTRTFTYTPIWSAGVWGLHLAIAGA